MKIKNQLLLALGALLLAFIIGVWHYAQFAAQSLNERWAQRLIEKQLFFDKNRTLQPILHEIALATRLTEEPAILKMALNDNDLQARQQGLAVLEHYRTQFQDQSYFAAFRQTQHYFYNDADNTRQNNPLAYTLNPKKSDDLWFFKALELTGQPYQINVNKDTVLGTTKVWINMLLKHQGKVIAVLGTGLELDTFLKQSVDIQQPGIRNFFINDQLSIQLDRDARHIQFASFTKPAAEQDNLSVLIKNPTDLQTIKTLIQEFKQTPQKHRSQTFWSSDPHQASLIGITYLPEINWFDITIFAPEELVFIDPWYLVISLTGLLFLLLLILFRVNHALFITPLLKLTQSIQTIRKGNYDINLPIQTGYSLEIEVLSTEFKKLIEQIKFTQDALEHKVNERTQELVENEQKLHTILDAVQASIFIKDTQYRYVYANQTLLNYINKHKNEIIGKDDRELFPNKPLEKTQASDIKVIEQGQESREEEVNIDHDGQITSAFTTVKVPLRHEDGTIYALCGITWDITQQKRAEQEIQQQALYDNLTQLPNRRLLNERLSLALSISQRKQLYGAVIFLDLDNFKPLNDNHGHDFGDQLLIAVAQRLKQAVRETDTVTRFGGDEFILLLPELSVDFHEASTAMENFATKLLKSLNEPYELSLNHKQLTHQCSASIGIRIFKGQAYSCEQLVHHADQAMYTAKKQGKNRFHLSPFLG